MDKIEQLTRQRKQAHQKLLDAGLPVILTTPTWRANRQRVEASGTHSAINQDAVGFMTALRDRLPTWQSG
ncbi:MAG: hypothetical protein GY703_01095 [Gammaproteobacteria bacterium]|nr:hypothetical protein [Gammaproteobacteria bacterium]